MQKPGRDPRAAILDAAARLLREDGIGSVTTRRVAEAAGTQPPAIYRLFGDKHGLLQGVADHVMAAYVEGKSRVAAEESASGSDALESLRESYRLHVEFGLANPELFALMIAPGRALTTADAAGRDILRARVHRLAVAGALRVSEQRAVEMISAAGNGAILCALGSPEQERSPALGDAMLEAVLGTVLTAEPLDTNDETLQGAVSLAAITPQLPNLTENERQLMAEWLSRSIHHLQG